MPLPDPERSHAVLIGVHDYRQLEPLPGVEAGVSKLAELLCDREVWGLPRRNVTVFGARASADDILKAVRRAGRATTDTFLVYFAGHGRREHHSDQLHLALADADRDDVEIGALPYPLLLGLARRAGRDARRRVTLLDCCYSGLAIPMGDSATALGHLVKEPDAGEGGSPEDSGFASWIMTSTSRTELSFSPPRGYPYFTGALIDVLEHGIAGAGPTLSFDRIAKEAGDRLRTLKYPRPQCADHNAAGEESWVRNRAHEGPQDAPPRPVPHAGTGPAPRPAALSAEFPFDTVQGGGYRIGAVKRELNGVLATVGDPRLGWRALSPHFRTVSGRWFWGYDMRQVDAHIERQRADPTEFVDALRLLLARQGITVLPDGDPGGSRLRERCGALGAERLIGYAEKGAMTCTDTHLCLSSSALMRIPHSALEDVSLATLPKTVRTVTVTDQGGFSDESLRFITRVTFGHRTLEFDESSMAPVREALRAFLPAMDDLRRRRPEWFR
ncbi:caspase family protein [Streptomyces dangxiongensis]|uniref:caspase family protein n=1 Tax=Streptomyces dangxiongensis TaxID=1442032 RepID=UPI0013CED6A6|nr:caspase family protein [Streptomyces dangxiongensis]